MFYLSGIVITFFLSFLLMGKKGQSAADRILSAWLVVCGFHLGIFYLYISGTYLRFPLFLGLEQGLPLLHGPFLFLYVQTLTQGRCLRWRDGLHFLPIAIVYSLMIPFFALTGAEKIAVYQHQGAGYHWLTDPLFFVITASGVVYTLLCFRLLRQHRVAIENGFSDITRIDLNWVRFLVYGICVIWAVVVSGLDDKYVFASVVLYMFFIGYFGIRQVGIFTDRDLAVLLEAEPVASAHSDRNPSIVFSKKNTAQDDQRLDEEDQPFRSSRPRYQNSGLAQEDARSIHLRLQQIMATEKLFREPELNITSLARRLDVTPHSLSQVINTLEGKSFYDYVNELRVFEFKQLISDPGNQQYTLLGLAFDCGFNSKTAFNRNFKKTTGLSPTQFLQTIRVALPAAGSLS